mmetsp:Transcript_2179/g.7109  ORF Transcript_2179/g.7109 Transcript_2179/m.7109 type:complete len:466 (+) Transcript_2179:1221-2618(+)
MLTMRWTRAAGVQVRFGDDSDWRNLPGKLGRGHNINRFNAKVESTGLVRAFIDLPPESGSVVLVFSSGDLHALKQSLGPPPADLSKMFNALQEARALGVSIADIREVYESASGCDVDNTAKNALHLAIQDAVGRDEALRALCQAEHGARIRMRASNYVDVHLPADWKGRFAGRTGYAAFPCGQPTARLFERFLRLADGDRRLGSGRDERPGPAYSSVRFVSAWRIENPELWRIYHASRLNLFDSMMRMVENKFVDERTLRTQLTAIFQEHAWEPPLETLINELVLCHGTSPQFLDDILTNGLNPKYTRVAAYGHGVYFADDPIKANQYAHPTDEGLRQPPSELAALHEKLYRRRPGSTHEHTVEHPGDLRYIIVCRVLMGHYVRTNGRPTSSAAHDLMDVESPTSSIWDQNAVPNTELAKIPGTNINYHSLFVDRASGDGSCFNEFVQFHGNRIYPAFVVAYQRK